MQSDITLSYGNKVLIIDAKYYAHTMQSQYDTHTLHSNNLYQIFTYVKNKDVEFGDKIHEVSGMLLYARTDETIQPDNSYMMSGNRISVKTLDLNCSFPLIAAQLNAIADNLISWFSEMDNWGKTFIPQACERLKIKYWYAINKEMGSEEVILTALLKQDA